MNNFVEIIDKLSNEELADDACIQWYIPKIHNSSYIDADVFNNEYRKYLSMKLDNNEKLCDKNFSVHVSNVLNILYLDGDFTYSNSLKLKNENELETLNINMMNDHVNWSIRVLSRFNCFIIGILKFIPENIKHKGGWHVYILLKDNLNKTSRKEFYNTFQSIYKEQYNEKYYGTTELEFEKLFDKQPIVSANLLLPFATKPNAKRIYKLVESTLNDIEKFEIIPTHHNSSTVTGIAGNILNVSELGNNDFEMSLRRSGLNHFYDAPSSQTLCKSLVAFIKSLYYLHPEHPLYIMMSDHTERFCRFEMPIMKAFYAFYYFDTGKDLTNDYEGRNGIAEVVNDIVDLVIPILLKSTKIGEETDRYKKESSFNNFVGAVGEEWCKLREYAFFDEHMFPDMVELRKPSCFTVNIDSSGSSSLKYFFNYDVPNPLSVKCVKHVMCNLLNDFLNFVENIVNGITDELLPFKQFNDMTTVKGMKENIYTYKFGDIINSYRKTTNFTKENFYAGTPFSSYVESLRTIFIFSFISNCSKNRIAAKASILNTVGQFIKIFICNINEGESKIFIYSIGQIMMDPRYPINQWVEDPNGTFSRAFAQCIYELFLAPSINDRPIMTPTFKTFIPIIKSYGKLEQIKFQSFDMQTVFKNIETFNNTAFLHSNKPQLRNKFTTSDLFPYYNMVLDLRTNKQIKNGFISSITNLFRYEVIPEKIRKKMKIAENFISEIISRTDERVYVMKILAAGLLGSIKKDQFFILYGEGGDGKSTFISIINMIFGNVEECNTEYESLKTNSLVGTVKQEYFIKQKSKFAKSHDEGGFANCINCRVILSNEFPADSILDANKIKPVTGNDVIEVRRIRKESRTVTMNTLIFITTNSRFGIEPMDDALKRRLVVIGFKNRFRNKIDYENTKKYYQNDTTNKLADEEKASKIKSDMEMVEAFHYYCLTYINSLNSVSKLSDIIPPPSIIKDTEIFVMSGSQEGRILNKILDECVDCMMEMEKLRDALLKIQSREDNNSKITMENVCRTLNVNNKYKNNIFKINDGLNIADIIKDGTIEPYNSECLDGSYKYTDISLLINNVFDVKGTAVSIIEYKDSLSWKELYIIGYKLNESAVSDIINNYSKS